MRDARAGGMDEPLVNAQGMRTGFTGWGQAASVPAGRPSSVKAGAAASAAGAGSSIRASQHRLTARASQSGRSVR